nr:hypothetical protein [Tanacetum cinerariifolium]
MAGTDNESGDASVHSHATNAQQQPNIQPQIITTVSNNNAKFPYLKKDEYENAVKARFGGNAESKKMRKSMLKQEFSEFRIGEAEGLHKGALPSSWAQVALTLKTKGGLELLSFNDLYYKLKTLEVDVKGYTTFFLSHSAFVSATSASKKRFGNVIEDVLQSFVADTEPEQQLAYEDFEQIKKLDLEEMDLKWQMAMLSVRVHKFEQKAGRKIDFDKKESASESDGVIAAKEFGMIASYDSKDAIEESTAKIYNLITGADTEEASTTDDAGEFALMGVTSEENPFSDAEDEGIFDSGCSRSMTSNKDRLDDFQAFQGGKVTFRGGEGRITGKGTIRTPTLDFENVYYVKELQQFNLFSISQICDKKNRVLFTDTECLVLSKDFKLPDDSIVVLRVPKKHNLYTVNLNNLCPRGNLACLVAHASVDGSVKWHRRMGHVNYKNMNKLAKGNLVRGLPLKLFKNDHTCVACCKEHKNKTYPILKDFINLVENQLNKKVKDIRCDNGTKFKNAHVIELCGFKGIKREYSNARTLQQNRVAERKNRTLKEAARTMLADSKLHTMFWTEAVRTAFYVLDRVSITRPHNKPSYALLTGNISSVSHFKPFGCHVTILNISDHLGKFDGKADEGYIVGYSASNKAYKVYNVPNKRVEESMNLRFLEDKPNVQGLGHEWYFDLDYLTDTLAYKHVQANQSASIQGATIKFADTSGDEVDDSPLHSAKEIFQKELARLKGHAQRPTSDTESLSVGFTNDAKELQTQASAKTIPPGSIPVPTGNIPVPAGNTVVSINDVPVHTSSSTDSFFDDEPTTRFPSPSDLGNHDPSPGIFSFASYDVEFGVALNNVASTVEVNPVATTRINTIHPQSLIIGDPTLANVWALVDLPDGKYAIGTKWILKNKRDARGIIVQNKARLVAQGHRQEEGIDYDEVFAPVARIEAIRLFLAFASYMGFMIYQIDVKSAFLYGIIDEEAWCDEFEALMKGEFQMSAMGELTFFLGLQVQQRPDVSACSRNQVTHTTSNLEEVKNIFKYLKGQTKLGLWYSKESPLMLEAYSDSDYAGTNKDRKSTTGGCQFLGRRLISWQCKNASIPSGVSRVPTGSYVKFPTGCLLLTGSYVTFPTG